MHQRKFPWWVVPIVIIAACIGSVFYFRANPVVVKAASPDLAKVATTKIVTGTIVNGIETTGTVRTNQNETLTWGTSGQVAQVLVKVGDWVQKGQVLAQLDPASNPEWTTDEANLLAAQENLTSLQNVAVKQASAKITLINAQAAVATAQKALDDLHITVTEAQIDSANAAYLQAQKNVERLQIAYNVASSTADELTVAKALEALNSAVLTENQDLANLNNLKNYTPNATSLAKAKTNLALVQAKLAVAQASYDAVKNDPSEADVAAAQSKIDSIESDLESQTLLAPLDGTITAVDIVANDLVSVGTDAFRIDDMSSLYIDLSVAEEEINNLYVGQTMQLSYDAVAGRTYSAQVTAISASSTVSGGSANYTVTALLTDADSSILPGMTAAVDILTAQDSNVLLVPNLSIATLNGNKVVYLVSNGQLTPVQITVGLVSDTQTEIAATSLKSGDAIVLNPARIGSAIPGGAISAVKNFLLKLGVTTEG